MPINVGTIKQLIKKLDKNAPKLPKSIIELTKDLKATLQEIDAANPNKGGEGAAVDAGIAETIFQHLSKTAETLFTCFKEIEENNYTKLTKDQKSVMAEASQLHAQLLGNEFNFDTIHEHQSTQDKILDEMTDKVRSIPKMVLGSTFLNAVKLVKKDSKYYRGNESEMNPEQTKQYKVGLMFQILGVAVAFPCIMMKRALMFSPLPGAMYMKIGFAAAAGVALKVHRIGHKMDKQVRHEKAGFITVGDKRKTTSQWVLGKIVTKSLKFFPAKLQKRFSPKLTNELAKKDFSPTRPSTVPIKPTHKK